MYKGIDILCFMDFYRLSIRHNHHQAREILFPSTTTIKQVLTFFASDAVPVERLRMVHLHKKVHDGIYRQMVEISNPEVLNPIVIEETPEDQLDLNHMDKLLAVVYVYSTREHERFIASGYVRVSPYERLKQLRERLREGFRGEIPETSFSIEQRESKRKARIDEQTDLWNITDELIVLKVVVRVE
jgi:HD superfamily phosphohydrolase YqeK